MFDIKVSGSQAMELQAAKRNIHLQLQALLKGHGILILCEVS